MKKIQKSQKLDNVCYDIRGKVLQEAKRLEEEGHQIIKLNIGNPEPFGFLPPEEILQDVIYNLKEATGYSDSKGIFPARKAVMQAYQKRNIMGITIEDIYLGNGVSELIVMATQALLNNGDEVLIPAPDYPLWTASVSLAGGKPVHYFCDEDKDWHPNLEDIESKINDRTKALVLINPNNPTGALYPPDLLEALIEIARKNQLVILSDEIYDKILYDNHQHVSTAALAEDVLIFTFSGLSKAYRCAGFRSGWLVITGPKNRAQDLIEGLNILSSMRLCSNVPAQFAIQTALGGYQSINDLVLPTGRLCQQRDLIYSKLCSIPGVACIKPKGALYLFFKLCPQQYPIESDEDFVLELLLQEKLLLVPGSAFNISDQHHFRMVFLPSKEHLNKVAVRLEHFLSNYMRG